MVMLVLDTNILELATPKRGSDFNSEASELIWRILNDESQSIAVDEEGKIVEREYHPHLNGNQTLITWFMNMRLRNKVKKRPGMGFQIGNLQEMDNCFACVSMRTPAKILVSEDSDFQGDVKKGLAKKGVKVMKTNQCHRLICRE
jgi:hypothetical protein